eukprot:CAMPEP_0179018316 /NCGR_PEP_ID=MMETSP0796-20121207/4291_1 /TAXON_ID=73915 /ORGANISM="Pyrodinium bahamense, Strain pbaha01" /LENGTH=91 /DNA_ID=CAMNT_0020714071 /DNA_START=409 /DNA_END=680 /DNA_ORIENTATION=-
MSHFPSSAHALMTALHVTIVPSTLTWHIAPNKPNVRPQWQPLSHAVMAALHTIALASNVTSSISRNKASANAHSRLLPQALTAAPSMATFG